MNAEILVGEDALADIEHADRKWRLERTKNPKLFGEELKNAFDLLETFPEAGHLEPHDEIPELRVVPLKKTKYLMYFVFEASLRRVAILRVWYGGRGEKPQIRHR